MSNLRPLAECADFLSGGTPSKAEPRYWTGSIPWASAKDMKRLHLEDTEDHVSEEGVAAGSRLVPAGTTLVLARGMTLLHDVPISIAKRPMAFNQDVKGLLARPGVDPRFLAYALVARRDELLSFVELAGHGTGRLPTDRLKQLPLWMPPVAEQLAIAAVLGALDDKIDLNRRTNQTLDELAQALFRSWFVDFDPVRAKAEGQQPEGMDAEMAMLFPSRFIEAPHGELPAGWTWLPLDRVAHFLNGLALQKYPPVDSESLPVIKIAQLRRGSADDADQASAGIPPEYVVQDGDILFSWSGSLLVSMWAGGRGALNQHLFKVTSAAYPKWFYLLWCKKHLPEFQRIAQAKATTMGHIQRHHLTQALVAVPSPELIEAANQFFEPLLARWLANALECQTLLALRDTLLPKLLSGEIRVGEAEDQVAASA